MQRDYRETALYREAAALYQTLRRPGTGQISDASEVHVSPDASQAVFAGTIVDALQGVPPTRIFQIDLKSGNTRALTFGPNTDRLPDFPLTACALLSCQTVTHLEIFNSTCWIRSAALRDPHRE